MSGRPSPALSFVLDAFEPCYLALRRAGALEERAARARAALASCTCCPRACEVDRLVDEEGVCRTGREAVVSSAFAHFGEEDCLRGRRGSGTIFFAHCNLQCVFCQNADISQGRGGRGWTADEIADAMMSLQQQGCHNINFVTPEHVVPQVIEAIARAAERGLHVPIVYNTSAYDALSSLALLDGLVDIYMPDFKFWRAETAGRLSRAKDYPDRARDAILEMHRQVGPLRTDADGVACRGVLVRHLVMPGLVDESRAIFQWLADAVSPDTFVNIMGQYRPAHRVGVADRRGVPRHGDIDRRPSTEEMAAAYQAARAAGLWRLDGWV